MGKLRKTYIVVIEAEYVKNARDIHEENSDIFDLESPYMIKRNKRGKKV
jgi:hypothetical protein